MYTFNPNFISDKQADMQHWGHSMHWHELVNLTKQEAAKIEDDEKIIVNVVFDNPYKDNDELEKLIKDTATNGHWNDCSSGIKSALISKNNFEEELENFLSSIYYRKDRGDFYRILFNGKFVQDFPKEFKNTDSVILLLARCTRVYFTWGCNVKRDNYPKNKRTSGAEWKWIYHKTYKEFFEEANIQADFKKAILEDFSGVLSSCNCRIEVSPSVYGNPTLNDYIPSGWDDRFFTDKPSRYVNIYLNENCYGSWYYQACFDVHGLTPEPQKNIAIGRYNNKIKTVEDLKDFVYENYGEYKGVFSELIIYGEQYASRRNYQNVVIKLREEDLEKSIEEYLNGYTGFAVKFEPSKVYCKGLSWMIQKEKDTLKDILSSKSLEGEMLNVEDLDQVSINILDTEGNLISEDASLDTVMNGGEYLEIKEGTCEFRFLEKIETPKGVETKVLREPVKISEVKTLHDILEEEKDFEFPSYIESPESIRSIYINGVETIDLDTDLLKDDSIEIVYSYKNYHEEERECKVDKVIICAEQGECRFKFKIKDIDFDKVPWGQSIDCVCDNGWGKFNINPWMHNGDGFQGYLGNPDGQGNCVMSIWAGEPWTMELSLKDGGEFGFEFEEIVNAKLLTANKETVKVLN